MANEDTDLTFTTIIMLIITFTSAYLLIKTPLDFGSKQVAFKEAIARDVALTINVLCSYPYDASIKRNLDLENYIISFEDNLARIYSANDATISSNQDINVLNFDTTVGSYYFYCNTVKNTAFKGSSALQFTKIKNEITISAI